MDKRRAKLPGPGHYELQAGRNNAPKIGRAKDRFKLPSGERDKPSPLHYSPKNSIGDGCDILMGNSLFKRSGVAILSKANRAHSVERMFGLKEAR